MNWLDSLLDALLPSSPMAAGRGAEEAGPQPTPHLSRLARRDGEMNALGITRGLFHLAAQAAEEPAGDAAYVDLLRGMFFDMSYVPGLKRFRVKEVNGKLRELVSPRGLDAVMLRAWAMLAEARVERVLLDHVHGFRKGRGPHSAARALAGVRLPPGGALIRADIRRMFPSLRRAYMDDAAHAVLGAVPGVPATERFHWREVDPLGHRLLAMLKRWLDAWGVPGGLPQGLCVSPMLSNVYMSREVDPWIATAMRSGLLLGAVRYADDFALVSPCPAEALEGLRRVVERCHLALHPEKTKVIVAEGDWPQRVLGVEIDLAAGVLRPRHGKTSGRRRKPASGR